MPTHRKTKPAEASPEPHGTPPTEPGRHPGAALAGPQGDDSVESRIYRTIFESIMGQRLAPGTKLPEAALCELFGTTRTTVRQALTRLAHDHIVQLRPHKGAMVMAPTAQETQHVFEARRGLEDTLVRLAAERATPLEIEALRRQLRQEHDAMHRFNQPAWSRLASGFHLLVAQVARNPILQRYLAEMISRCSLIVALYEQPGNASCEHDEHTAMVDCIAAHDGEGAARLMHLHLMELERNVMVRIQACEEGGGLRQMLGL
ncbi:FCD domain-containing protein [Xylophilus sp. Kf1]|nr:FCD domain-containing protein [Xylophilus sp. Kf1]